MMDISYTLIRSARKTISIQIGVDGNVVVRCPKRCPKRDVDAFVQSKRGWIEGHLIRMERLPQFSRLTGEELSQLADQAAQTIPKRVRYYATLVGVSYGRITIRSQHTRWGSCSAGGNLNFNCLLMLAPLEVLDYVVVHELCHRKQLNHSPDFWAEVEKVCPDYRIHKQWLKENGNALIGRLPLKEV